MKVLVTGPRDWGTDEEKTALEQALGDALDSAYADVDGGEEFILVHGDATGADAVAKEWAADRYITQRVYPADWEKYGAPAGPRRNLEMITRERPDLVIACRRGASWTRGTAHTVSLAENYGIRLVVAEVPGANYWHPDGRGEE